MFTEAYVSFPVYHTNAINTFPYFWVSVVGTVFYKEMLCLFTQ